MMERKKILMSEGLEDVRKKMFQEMRDLYEKISGEEMEVPEINQNLGGNVQRKEGVPKWKKQLLLELVSLRWQLLGLGLEVPKQKFFSSRIES